MRLFVGIAVLCAALAPALAGGAPAATKEVRVTDSAVSPFQVNVAVGDSVRWRNGGTRAHTIASDTGAWRAFTLRPARTKSVRFTQAGCFNYKVDGRVRGRVAVAASCASGGGGGGGGDGTGPTIFRYDVTVTGSGRTVQRHSGDEPGIYDNNGTVDVKVTWTSTFKNVAVKKVAGGGAGFVMTNSGGLFARGTTDLVFAYKHDRKDTLGPCSGSFALKSMPSNLRLAGYQGLGLGNELSLGSQMSLAAGGTFADRIRSACPDYSDEPRWIEIQGHPEPDIVRGGFTWEDVDPITLLTVSAKRKATRTFRELESFAQGRGFTIRTGPIRNEAACHFGSLARVCTETFEGFLVVKLVPRRR